MPTPQPLRVLVLCTGNISRSPVVEHLLRSDLADNSVEISSAGIQAVVGAPIGAALGLGFGLDPPMGALLNTIGIDSTEFRARQLKRELLDNADLVIGLAREHRSYAVQLEPSVVRRSFTLREFVRILPMAGPYFGATIGERLRAAAEAAALARSRVPASRPGEDDVTDPYGAPVQVYRRVFAEIHDSVAQIAKAVC